MSDKDLQRLTECVSYIGQTVSRCLRPTRRHHVTQKVQIARQHTLHLSIHDDPRSADISLRFKGPYCSSELIDLYDVIARLMSLALQYGAPLEKAGDLLAGAKCAPCGWHLETQCWKQWTEQTT